MKNCKLLAMELPGGASSTKELTEEGEKVQSASAPAVARARVSIVRPGTSTRQTCRRY